MHEVFRQSIPIEAAIDPRKGRDRVQFRAEREPPVRQLSDIERLLPERISGEDQFALLWIPAGEGEHAAQFRQYVEPPDLKPFQENFRVRIGGEISLVLLQFLAKLKVVVNLAVEDDEASRTIAHRLRAARG